MLIDTWTPFLIRSHRGKMIPAIARDFHNLADEPPLVEIVTKRGWGYLNKAAFLRKSVRCEQMYPMHRKFQAQAP